MVLGCTGTSVHEGPSGAQRIKEKFTHSWHTNVKGEREQTQQEYEALRTQKHIPRSAEHPPTGGATAPSVRRHFLALLLAICVGFEFQSPMRASELKQRTAQAFDRYVQLTEVRILSEVTGTGDFLHFDSLSERERNSILARVHSGDVVIEPMRTLDKGKEIHVPDGLAHHWLAIGFIPGATLDQALTLAQDYTRHPELYAPDVQRAHVLAHDGQHFSVYYRFYRHAIVTVIYNTEFSVDYFLPDPSRGYCFARSVRIAELQDPGNPDEKELPVGNDHGYMWRLNLYTRYIEKDNGVYVEIEFVALSRSVPWMFALLVNPYLRSIPHDYLTNYIHATQRALSPNVRSDTRSRLHLADVKSGLRFMPTSTQYLHLRLRLPGITVGRN